MARVFCWPPHTFDKAANEQYWGLKAACPVHRASLVPTGGVVCVPKNSAAKCKASCFSGPILTRAPTIRSRFRFKYHFSLLKDPKHSATASFPEKER